MWHDNGRENKPGNLAGLVLELVYFLVGFSHVIWTVCKELIVWNRMYTVCDFIHMFCHTNARLQKKIRNTWKSGKRKACWAPQISVAIIHTQINTHTYQLVSLNNQFSNYTEIFTTWTSPGNVFFLFVFSFLLLPHCGLPHKKFWLQEGHQHSWSTLRLQESSQSVHTSLPSHS